MNNKVKPALIGGVLLGLLSVIPFVNALNICCCLWAILGGMLASYLYVKNSPTPATPGDGAFVGALAGIIGAVISLIIGIPISYAMGPAMRNWLVGSGGEHGSAAGGNDSATTRNERRFDRFP